MSFYHTERWRHMDWPVLGGVATAAAEEKATTLTVATYWTLEGVSKPRRKGELRNQCLRACDVLRHLSLSLSFSVSLSLSLTYSLTLSLSAMQTAHS